MCAASHSVSVSQSASVNMGDIPAPQSGGQDKPVQLECSAGRNTAWGLHQGMELDLHQVSYGSHSAQQARAISKKGV
jgi:hypothetical protein